MLGLSIEEVDRVARLARLELAATDRDRFALQLGAILGYAGQLARVETPAAATFAHAPIDRLPERADDPAPCLAGDDAIGQAPGADRDARLFRVPRVIGG